MMEGKGNCSATTANNQSKKIKTTNADLPEEIIRDILIRLPVKSLLRFSCVSTSWLSLISSPPFVKDHLEFSSKNANSTNQRVMFNTDIQLLTLKQCPVSSSMFQTATFGSDVDHPYKSALESIEVVGSCNGIICIMIDSTIISLWNPSTRKSKVVLRFQRPYTICTWGFGYVESEDDYKIVGAYRSHESNESNETLLGIYSLRNDSWKSIEKFGFGTVVGGHGKFAGGKLHFLAWLQRIVSIDLKSETSAFVKKPNHDDGCYFTTLALLGSCLSFVCNYLDIRADVWILNECGANDSWTRVVSLPFNGPYTHHIYTCFPFLIMPKGEIALCCGSYIVVYNSTGKYLRFPQISCFHSHCVYFESLVPI